MINQMRRNPTDHPSLGLRKRKGRPKRPRLVFPTITQPEEGLAVSPGYLPERSNSAGEPVDAFTPRATMPTIA